MRPSTQPARGLPRSARWVGLCLLVLAVILAPFFLFGARLETWTAAFLRSASQHSLAAGVVLSGLLAADILLPVPSSVVSTGAGFVLGFPGGFVASWVGMSVSCLIGYGLGARSGRRLSNRLLGGQELERLEHLHRRFGDWSIVVSRAVPVLAEASVLFAGIGLMRFSRFFLLCSLSNAAISAAYAAVGASSASLNSFLLAFSASLLMPLAALAVMNLQRQPATPGCTSGLTNERGGPVK